MSLIATHSAVLRQNSAMHRWIDSSTTRLCLVHDFAPRFLERYAKANRLKPSGIAAKGTIRRVHLIPVFGDKALDTITTEDVQRLKSALTDAHRRQWTTC